MNHYLLMLCIAIAGVVIIVFFPETWNARNMWRSEIFIIGLIIYLALDKLIEWFVQRRNSNRDK